MGSAQAARKTTAADEELLTRQQLADAIGNGTHAQTITKWVAAGMPVAQRGRSGKPHLYRLSDVRAWLNRREMENAAPSPEGPLTLNQQRALKEHWQAKLNEQKHREREGELIPREDVEREWSAEVAAVRARLLAIPTTLADQLHRAAVIDGVPGVEAALNESIRAVLTELADPKRKDPGDEKPKRKRKPAVRKKAAKKKRATKKTTRKKAAKKKRATKKTTAKKATRKKAATRKPATKKKKPR